METDFQQGCCPFHLKLTVVISLTNSDKNNKKKRQALANNSRIISSYLLVWRFFHLPQGQIFSGLNPLLYDIFSTTLIRSILTCN